MSHFDLLANNKLRANDRKAHELHRDSCFLSL